MPETESIDRLFLELSQFTTAKTKREIELEDLLTESILILESVQQAYTREGWQEGATHEEVMSLVNKFLARTRDARSNTHISNSS